MNPLITLSVLAVLVLLLGTFNQKKLILPLIVLGLLVSIGFSIADWSGPKSYFNDMYVINKGFLSFSILLQASVLFIILISQQFYKTSEKSPEDVLSIILFSLIGSLIMIGSGNLVTFFVGFEIMSVSLYFLAGSDRKSKASSEAAIKYFILGSVASAFMLFGIALVYGATGSMDFTAVMQHINAAQVALPMILKSGILLVALGMAFKIGAAPFHFWVPDVYQGSPTLITAFMSSVIKVAGFAAFYRLTTSCFANTTEIWSTSLAVIAALSIIIGNFGGLLQEDSKRMMAYSSIAHTGYILLAIVAFDALTLSVLLYYSTAYILSNILAFSVIIGISGQYGNTGFSIFNGLAKKNGFISFAMAIAMVSLTGIPPLAGFMAKYLVFVQAMNMHYLWLVIIAIIGSTISIFYYFRPIISMYFVKEPVQEKIVISRVSIFVLIILSLLSLAFGFVPGIFHCI